jgi:NAD(P)-dependent dehydrogenase (short-subunit alcohol dehydrogenase family)
VFVEADHSKVEDCQRVVDVALKEFGRIDILFNNAGIVTKGTAETTDEETWQIRSNINVTAVWRMSKLVIPHMKNRGTWCDRQQRFGLVGGGGEGCLPVCDEQGRGGDDDEGNGARLCARGHPRECGLPR